MRSTAIVGFVLVVLGLAALAYERVDYATRETVIDVGPVHATADRQGAQPLSPVVGSMVMAGGIVLLLASVPRVA